MLGNETVVTHISKPAQFETGEPEPRTNGKMFLSFIIAINMLIWHWMAIPGQIDQRFQKLTPSYFIKIWNLVFRVVWYAEDDWANIGALQARVNEL